MPKAKSQIPLKEREDLKVKRVPRQAWSELVAAQADTTWIDGMDAEAAIEAARYPRIFTHLIDVDTLFAPTVGSRIEISGMQTRGKSTLCYIMAGSLLRTCRDCCTFAAAWIDDDTGEVVERCRCGKNNFMEGAIADVERSCDPIWMNLWGCRTIRETFEEKRHKNEKGFKILEGGNPRLHILRPVAGSAMYSFIQRGIEIGALDFVIIDSMNSIISDDHLEKEAGGGKVADRARMHWDGLRRIVAAQNYHFNQFRGLTTVIWTNHLIAQIQSMTGGGPKSVEACGGGPSIESDQRMRIEWAKFNDGKKDLPFHAYIDSYFKVNKNKAGFASGASGSFRLFVNRVEHDRVVFDAGETDDANRLYGLLKELGLFTENKNKYIVLGREFTRVADMKKFLSREDVALEVRYWVGLLRMPTIGRKHLKFGEYCYSPFDSAKRYYERTAEILQKKIPGLDIESSSATEPPAGEDAAAEPERKPAIRSRRRAAKRDEEEASCTDVDLDSL